MPHTPVSLPTARPRRRPAPRFWLGLGLVCAAAACGGCVDDESIFTQGRLEDLCNEAIPACNAQASCLLQPDEFYTGHFPGGLRVLVRTEAEDQHLIVRILLTEMLYPGTEMLVQAHTPDCSNLAEENPVNVDLFQLAGDDRTLEFELDLPGRGDHLVEIFSDMSSDYLLAISLEEQ